LSAPFHQDLARLIHAVDGSLCEQFHLVWIESNLLDKAGAADQARARAKPEIESGVL